MKDKIKEALRQEFKSRLELHDEQLEGVAAFAATFVTDEAKIEEFVKSEATLTMLKSYQSMLDKDRAKRGKGQQDPDPANNPDPKPQDQPKVDNPQPQDMAKIIAEAVAAAIKPISDELASFKGEQTAKAALESAKAQFFGDDYVKMYGDEASDAWDVAMEIYKYNPEWTAEQINGAAMGRFKKAVGKKGVDTSKPFPSDGGGGDNKPDFKAMADRLKARGKIAGEPTE